MNYNDNDYNFLPFNFTYFLIFDVTNIWALLSKEQIFLLFNFWVSYNFKIQA